MIGSTSCVTQATKDDLTKKLNHFLGKTLAERIRIEGEPDSCDPHPEGGELCSWETITGIPPYQGAFMLESQTFLYATNGFACGWVYTGESGHLAVDRCDTTNEARPQ
ncbi:MAG: hypothetical protein K0U66_00625 [Gammaproteobacteria bacterium]|nr:hypothetical protein [Gammaproteobacteria bacterium]